MTQAVAQVRNVVSRTGFANPLTLGVLVTDSSYVDVYADDELLTEGADYIITGIGNVDGIEIEIIGAEDPDNYVGVETFTALYDPPLDQQADLSSGGVLGRAFELGLDQMNRRLQALADPVGRALKMPPNVEANMTIPWPPVDTYSLAWNAATQSFDWVALSEAAFAAGALPPGGTAGQLLRKASNTDFDTEWVDGAFTAEAISFSPTGGVSALTVQGAIAELDTEKLSIASAAATYLSQAAAAATYLTIAAAAATYLTIAGAAAAYQPLDSDLTAIAALNTTSFGRSLLTQNDAAAARTTLGVTGTIGGTLGATDNVVPRSDGTGGLTLQASGVAIDDSNYVTGIARITLDAAPAFDLASGALATQLLVSLGSTSPVTVTNKTFSAIRLSEAGGGNLVFAVTHTDGVASGLYSSVEAHSTSDAGSDVYGAVLHATNAGPGTTRGAHIGGYGVTGSTGILNALAAELQPVSTQGFTSGLFVALNSSGVHDKAIGVAVESGNGDRYLVAYGNGVAALPVNVAYFRAWMATGSSANARAFALLDNGGSEIAYWKKTGEVVGVSLVAASETNGITISQAAVTRNNAAGSMTFAAGTNAGNTFAIQTGGSTRFDVSDTASRANGYLHSALASAPPAGGSASVGIRVTSTTNLGIYFGTGAPTLSAGKGSLYSRVDATTTTTRLYINTDGGTTWATFTASA